MLPTIDQLAHFLTTKDDRDAEAKIRSNGYFKAGCTPTIDEIKAAHDPSRALDEVIRRYKQ